MPVYHYTCDKKEEERCKISNLPEEFFEGKDIGIAVNLESRLNVIDNDGNIDADISPLVWFVNHGMLEEPDIRCPVCEGKTRKVMCAVPSYVRGNCYLDVEGCRRDMNIYKLQNDDPYAYMRQPGEKDEMIAKLKRGNKAKPKYFTTGGSAKSS
jgi:predicted nucleic acid-binding Zn ribbon protein